VWYTKWKGRIEDIMLKPYFENLWQEDCCLIIIDIRLGYDYVSICVFNFVFGISYEYYKT
jgi:hypothetical protein